MQQYITSAEACQLLDRVLQTVQSLNAAFSALFPPPATIPEVRALEATVPEPSVVPAPEPVAPVLTIKLSDLVRASDNVQRRNKQHKRHQRQNHQPRHERRVRNVEVVYRRAFRMVS
jgi:hypothetical protein